MLKQTRRGNVLDASQRWREDEEDESGEIDALEAAIRVLGRSLETEISYATGGRLKELKRAKRDLSKIKQRVSRAR